MPLRSLAVMESKFRRMSLPALLVPLVLAAGLATGAGGDEPPIQPIMEQIHTRNRAIARVLRSPTALEAAGRQELAVDAAFLVRLGKEARGLTEPANEQKRSRRD
jgi:hypothetical protein